MPFFLVLDHNLRACYVDTMNNQDLSGLIRPVDAQQGDPADPALSRHAFALSDPVLCPRRMNVKGSCRLLFEKFEVSRQWGQNTWMLERMRVR